MNSQNDYVQIMLRFVREAGELALSLIDESRHSFKADKTIVTNADKAISALVHEHLKETLRASNHLLIDEEDPVIAEYLDEQRLAAAEYIWSVDPIDGTRLYANALPTFGISIGLLKNRRPWMGVVYFPVLKEMFYCDGEGSYFVQQAFTKDERRRPIVPVDQEISAKTLFFCNDTFFRKFGWSDPKFHILIQACAVVNLLWPTVGRGCGCFLRSSLWDFAGCWPIIRSAGLDLRRVTDGKVMDYLDLSLFSRSPKPWELNEYYLLSSARNFPIIRSKITQAGCDTPAYTAIS